MILGIDPGVRKLWYALINPDLSIVDSGILLLEEKQPTRVSQFTRIKEIYDFFVKLLKKHTIKKVGVEKLFFTKYNQNNAEFVYGIRWALMMLFVQKGIDIREFTPIELKKFVTGNGKAEKILVQKCIMKLYSLQNCPQFSDAADALALAYIANKLK
jgi:crossover junction endodeoxyribonuclease RuvC